MGLSMEVPESILDKAIQTQEEFIRRYHEKYGGTPEFDVLILAIMNELKERKEIEKGGQACEKQEG